MEFVWTAFAEHDRATLKNEKGKKNVITIARRTFVSPNRISAVYQRRRRDRWLLCAACDRRRPMNDFIMATIHFSSVEMARANGYTLGVMGH